MVRKWSTVPISLSYITPPLARGRTTRRIEPDGSSCFLHLDLEPQDGQASRSVRPPVLRFFPPWLETLSWVVRRERSQEFFEAHAAPPPPPDVTAAAEVTTERMTACAPAEFVGTVLQSEQVRLLGGETNPC